MQFGKLDQPDYVIHSNFSPRTKDRVSISPHPTPPQLNQHLHPPIALSNILTPSSKNSQDFSNLQYQYGIRNNEGYCQVCLVGQDVQLMANRPKSALYIWLVSLLHVRVHGTAQMSPGHLKAENSSDHWLSAKKSDCNTISYTIPSGGEFGVAHLVSGSNPPVDVALEMVKNGWAKLRENTKPGNADDENDGESSEQDRRNQLKEAEETARREGRGVWAEDTPNLEINYSMPEDPAAFLSEYKGKNSRWSVD
ncbi:hypothetical protein PGT21_002972 [Puccinia graminis f. sp. tritici]|uniref:Uncharacterized protein n=1 Tax=Puccinia graminis f. sp. tritici TaxID=56615 RepID=A0A5B0PE31_PUCGR|nr:hypothetical protein PGT21_002972 [Puccinia graminis f. sp. tritici]